ncbi:hypothetical protein DAQ1742_03747 [Dickeya aquatica]|uniref:Uncharacterized protein n=1 Tax=Dickeya aquatica TaxID=1401087 RepID=A0A375AF77_9GAMM|nr:hypothetical protein DAQ1742_03747 [Dickeya aquatica]
MPGAAIRFGCWFFAWRYLPVHLVFAKTAIPVPALPLRATGQAQRLHGDL